jgi:hypothetical protein
MQIEHKPQAHAGGAMHAHEPVEMIRQMREKWLWTNYTVIALGAWLMSSPFSFGYRGTAMTISDVVSGALLVILATIALRPRPRNDFWGRWGVCFVGVWLQFAPLVFWAPEAVAFVTDTFVGAWAIALSILVPMMPGMAHHLAMMKPGPEVPPGWSYNPSTWHQRAPIIICGFAGWFISRALAAVQLGYIERAWEPFFGEGTQRVLHSDVSRAWPISDAGLGALAYTIEALMGFMGGQARWRTMPWMVTFFGILVIPLGITHIVLVTLQPVVVGEWCTLCLAAATIMLVMIPLTVDEVVAMVQFMFGAKREGKPLWRTFWVGDTIEGGGSDLRTPRYGAPARKMLLPMVWGATLPWNLVASIVLGLWLMFAPAVLGTRGGAADNDHLAGALALTIAAIATAEVIRAIRWLNAPLGVWLIVAPWFLTDATSTARWSDAVIGLALVLLSLRRGSVREQYGGWNRYIR